MVLPCMRSLLRRTRARAAILLPQVLDAAHAKLRLCLGGTMETSAGYTYLAYDTGHSPCRLRPGTSRR